MSSGGLVGFRATPASQPLDRISSSVRWRWMTTSGWTVMLATPASTKEGIRLSGLVICRWASMGRSMAAASEAATIGPMVRLGTKWLSITSKWTRSAPPLCARCTSSARFAKSAASIEGAPTTLSPSSPKYVNRSPSCNTATATTILQNRTQIRPKFRQACDVRDRSSVMQHGVRRRYVGVAPGGEEPVYSRYHPRGVARTFLGPGAGYRQASRPCTCRHLLSGPRTYERRNRWRNTFVQYLQQPLFGHLAAMCGKRAVHAPQGTCTGSVVNIPGRSGQPGLVPAVVLRAHVQLLEILQGTVSHPRRRQHLHARRPGGQQGQLRRLGFGDVGVQAEVGE